MQICLLIFECPVGKGWQIMICTIKISKKFIFYSDNCKTIVSNNFISYVFKRNHQSDWFTPLIYYFKLLESKNLSIKKF